MRNARLDRAAPIAAAAVLALGCAAPVPGSLQPPATPDTAPRPDDGALVELDQTEPADRGAVPIGQPVSRTVTIRNVTGARVRLRVLGTSCPCLLATVDPRELTAGGTATVRLLTTAAEVPSQQWYNADLEAVAEDPPAALGRRQRLRISIAYTPDIEAIVSPSVGNMLAVTGQSATFDLLVRRLDSRRAEIERVDMPGDWIRLARISRDPLDPAIAVLTLETLPRPAGLERGRVDVWVRGEPEPRNHVHLSLRVENPLVASPAGLVWRQHDDGWREQGGHDHVVLTPHPLAAGRPSPAQVALSPPSTAIRASLRDLDPDAGRWTVAVTFDPAQLDRARQHGRTTLEVRDRDGRILAACPVVWFARSALAPGRRE